MNCNRVEEWDNEDPVDNWECDLKGNESIRGNWNSIIANVCIGNSPWHHFIFTKENRFVYCKREKEWLMKSITG
jgi:hypothetical protein